MPTPNSASIRQQLERTVGPAPWYWKTFPAFRSLSGQRFVWTHHGDQGPIAYVVSLALEQEPDKPRLALNTYCRPFLVLAASSWHLVSGGAQHSSRLFRSGSA